MPCKDCGGPTPQEFSAFLHDTANVVASWPRWKQDILGGLRREVADKKLTAACNLLLESVHNKSGFRVPVCDLALGLKRIFDEPE